MLKKSTSMLSKLSFLLSQEKYYYYSVGLIGSCFNVSVKPIWRLKLISKQNSRFPEQLHSMLLNNIRNSIPLLYFSELNMNSKAFVVLFFTIVLIGAVHSTGSIDTNVYNGALNVPLLVRYSSRFLRKLEMKPHCCPNFR